MDVFQEYESEVRSYCRSFPAVFQRAKGEKIWDDRGNEYLDFFAGAGALNYGHNNEVLKSRLLDYIRDDGISHSLDMSTRAKAEFLEAFQKRVLAPRDMDHKIMFPGPTGTNAVESALKLARKVTGRHNVVAFTNGFHGMTLGSLALTGNEFKRSGAGLPLHGVSHVPYDGYLGGEVDSIGLLEQLLADGSSGLEQPAAVVVETLQAEGGLNVASREWLQRLARLTREAGALLIIDDIQVGCGRTGPFFSFDFAEISPDIVCLSKSISGWGLPFAIVTLRRDLDCFDPGEHNGTFRGNNLAFVTATAALQQYWSDDRLERCVLEKAKTMTKRLKALAQEHGGEWRGRGMLQGIAFENPETASKVSRAAFERNLIFETSGPDGEVMKIMPPLTIGESELERGLDIVAEALAAVFRRSVKVPVTKPAAESAESTETVST